MKTSLLTLIVALQLGVAFASEKPDPKLLDRIDDCLTKMDSEDQTVRDAATAELAKFDAANVALLQEKEKNIRSPEVRSPHFHSAIR